MNVEAFAKIEAEFKARIGKMVWCNVATVDTKGRPRSRILHPVWEGSTGWIATRATSLKAKHLDHNPYVSLAYVADIVKPVYVECVSKWVHDQAEKTRVWDYIKSVPPPVGWDPGSIWTGPDDPGYGLLKLTPWRVDLYSFGGDSPRLFWQPKQDAQAIAD